MKLSYDIRLTSKDQEIGFYVTKEGTNFFGI